MELARNAATSHGDAQVTFRLPEELRDDAAVLFAGADSRPRAGEADMGDDGRYELWSVQLLGKGLALQDLEGADCCVDVELSPASAAGGEVEVPTHDVRSTAFRAPNSAREYVIQLLPNGSLDQLGAGANESMRLIVPATKSRNEGGRSANENSDSSSDSEGDKGSTEDDEEFSYRPYPQQFSRHCSIISHHPPAEGPDSTSPSPRLASMRRAYEPVPQQSGLKRRWVPFGATIASLSRAESNSTDGDIATGTPTAAAVTTASAGAAPGGTDDGDDTHRSTQESLTAGKRPPKQPQQQEAGQATSATHAPLQPTSSGTSELAREPSDDRADELAAGKAAQKAAKKEAKKAAKKEAKKKDKKRGRKEGNSSS